MSCRSLLAAVRTLTTHLGVLPLAWFVLTRLSHVKPGTDPVPGVAPAGGAAD